MSVDKNGNCNLLLYVMILEKKGIVLCMEDCLGYFIVVRKWVLYWLIDIVYLYLNFLYLCVLKEFERLLVYLSYKFD